MQPPQDIAGRLDGLRQGFQTRMGVRGRSLGQAMARARHLLPRRLYRQADTLARAEAMASHPRLRLLLDETSLGRSLDEVGAHLAAFDRKDRRKGIALGIAASLAVNLLVLGALVTGLLVWRGYL